MKKLFYVILVIGIIVCCISVEKESNFTKIDNCITYNLGQKPNNLLMTDNFDIRKKDLLIALFQGLVTEDLDGEIIPALAKEYKISEDGLGYTFTLRENLKYMDGKEINAKSFVEFFKEFLEDKDNVYANQLDCIFGAKEFREGKRSFQEVAITAKEKNVLVIRLNYKCPYFIKILSHPVYALRDYNNLKKNINNNFENTNSSGPFYIKEITKNNELILVKNDNYYNKRLVTNEKIKIKFVEDKEKALAYYELPNNNEDNIDLLVDSPINEYLRLSQEDKVISYPSNLVFYLNFNINKKSIINDINFRNAINSIISKEYYSQQISKNYAKPASLYTPKNNSSEKLFSTYGNKELAMSYLKKTKFTGKEEITFIYEEDSFNKRISDDIVKNITEDLKIKIKLVGYEKEKIKEILKNGDYDIYLHKYAPEFNDLFLYYEQWYSKSPNNIIKYNNSKYDEIYLKARYEMDEEKRYLLFRQCENLLKEDLPAAPIYYINTIICTKPNLSGIYSTSLGNIRLEYLKVIE